MFTGIVQAAAPIARLDRHASGIRLGIALPPEMLKGLNRGASVAIDGVCLSATDIEDTTVFFDAVPGTLARTNLRDRDPGQRVNVERSLVFGAEIGGHPVSGHVGGTVTVVGLERRNDIALLDVALGEWERYVFPRGFVALNGCSLTVADTDDTGLCRVNVIPETLRQTSLGDYRPGDRLNIEVDTQTVTIVDTIERALSRKGRR